MDYKKNNNKKYCKPILTVHGDLVDITLGDKCCPPDEHGAGVDSKKV